MRPRQSIVILMADDDADDRAMTKEALEENRLANPVYFVEDGESLMDYLYRRGRFAVPGAAPTPGLILLDLNMPKKDGREALAEIKADPQLRHIPVVVLTTSKAEEDIFRSYDLGASSFITKPVTFESLVQYIKTLGEYSPIRILLIEDDQDDHDFTRELLARIRSGTRYELEWVRHYEPALKALVEDRHDVALLDYRLGARDGLELLRDAIRRAVRVPIIVMTGHGDTGIEQEALAAGAADYLVKGAIDGPLLERSIRHSLERGRSIEALRDRERQFRAVFEASIDAMMIADDDGRYVDANEAAFDLLGITRAELAMLKVGDIAAPGRKNPLPDKWQAFLQEGRAEGEFQLRGTDGTERIVEFRARASYTPGRHLSVLRDVTERRNAEKHRLRLAAIVESAADAIEGLTLEGIVDYWSPAAERMYGYRAEEIVGQPNRILIPEHRAAELATLIERVREGEAVRHIETERRRKDGTTFVASVTMSPVIQSDRVVALSVITRDITEKKQLEAHLAVSERMASVGTLAAGVAHEINNPLAAVIANLDFLSQGMKDLERSVAEAAAPDPSVAFALTELREPLADARSSADRIRHVVRDLKLFSKPDEERRGAVDLRRVIDSSLRMAWNEIRHRARVVKDFGDVPFVEGNEARLGQVFLNLIVNAAQAIRDGDVDRNEIRIVTRQGEAGRVVAEVRDTGNGIAPDALQRLFEPFFTTKPVGIGTGLGLSICRRIVHEFGGTITVESAAGKGSTFRVTLAQAREDVAASPVATTAAVVTMQREVAIQRGRVLVIDDEPLIARAVQRALRDAYEVTGAISATDALAQLRGGIHYDAIICDMMMPHMSGMDFYEALLSTLPEHASRVIFLSGGAFTSASREFLDRVPNLHVEKPFDASHLRTLINEHVRRSRVDEVR